MPRYSTVCHNILMQKDIMTADVVADSRLFGLIGRVRDNASASLVRTQDERLSSTSRLMKSMR
jgi:hypothetical protein